MGRERERGREGAAASQLARPRGSGGRTPPLEQETRASRRSPPPSTSPSTQHPSPSTSTNIINQLTGGRGLGGLGGVGGTFPSVGKGVIGAGDPGRPPPPVGASVLSVPRGTGSWAETVVATAMEAAAMNVNVFMMIVVVVYCFFEIDILGSRSMCCLVMFGFTLGRLY